MLGTTLKKIVSPSRGQPLNTAFGFSALKERAAIQEALKGRPVRNKIVNRPIKAAHDFVQLEIGKAPDVVGPPISILRIDKTGLKWIYPGKCEQNQSK